MRRIVLDTETTGLGGRALVTLGKRDVSQQLPWTRLTVGSPILLTEEKVDDGVALRGIGDDFAAAAAWRCDT